MPIVGGLDIHRKQLTFDYLDTVTGEVKRGQIAPADRAHLRGWLGRFAGRQPYSLPRPSSSPTASSEPPRRSPAASADGLSRGVAPADRSGLQPGSQLPGHGSGGEAEHQDRPRCRVG